MPRVRGPTVPERKSGEGPLRKRFRADRVPGIPKSIGRLARAQESLARTRIVFQWKACDRNRWEKYREGSRVLATKCIRSNFPFGPWNMDVARAARSADAVACERHLFSSALGKQVRAKFCVTWD